MSFLLLVQWCSILQYVQQTSMHQNIAKIDSLLIIILFYWLLIVPGFKKRLIFLKIK